MAQIYLLDANVFIEAARRYYAFDLVPAFWQALVDHADNGSVRSIDRVKHELLHDDVAQWARGEFRNHFASTDQADVIQAFREVMAWVHQEGQFMAAAKANFANVADGWLVAYARVYGCIVVTHERFDPNTRNRVLLPTVCRAFNVSTMDTFAMLRALGVRLG